MDNQQSTEKLPSSKAVIAYLAEQFPQCFTIEGEAKPLKIGIFEDLATRMAEDPKVSKTRLRGALRQYTNSWRYLRCIKVGEQRVDLDGAEAGIVEEDHAQHAQESLAESKAKAAEKRKAQQAEKATKEGTGKGPNKPARQGGDKGKSANDRGPKRAAAQRAGKVGATKSRKAEPKPEIKLEQMSAGAIEVGQQVQVKLGQSPVAGTVTSIEKSDIQVQLVSGITVKVKAENLFTEA